LSSVKFSFYERTKMSRIRLNQESRNKVNSRMRVHLEAEQTQEKDTYDNLKADQIEINDKAWKLAEQIVRRHYTEDDIVKARYLQDKFENVDTIQPDSCFHFHYLGTVEDRDYDNNVVMKKDTIEKHFDFRLNGSTDVENNSSHSTDSEYGYALLRDEIKAQEGCNPDILIEQDGKDNNPHLTKFKDANDKYLGDDDRGYGKEWNDKYQLDLIGREYCRDRSIDCKKEEFDTLMIWQQAKSKLIQCHTKWIETILEQCKLLKSVLRDHIYLEQTIELCNKMGITINETDILATTSKGIVVSNADVLSHLETLKNKTQTREQKILARKLYDQQQLAN